MAEEVFNLKANLDVAAAIQQGREFQKTLDALGDSGSITTKQLNQVSAANSRVEKTLGGASTSVRKYSEEFSALRKEAAEATKAIQKTSQAGVVSGGRNPLSSAASGMGLAEAQKILAVQKASGITAEQVAAEVVRSEKKKQAAIQETRRVLQEANAASAGRYQSARTDPRSFLGQANSRDASTGLKASDTSWAIQARQQQAFRQELAATEVSFQKQQREAELTSLRYAILGRHSQEAATSVKKASAEVGASSENYIALRYAMYDVGRTALTVSASITALGTAAVASFAKQESAFTSVERTLETGVTQDAIDDIHRSLIDMSTEVPLAFGELAEIATIGNQMGIEAGNILGFTDSISKFAAITGISIEETTKAFGGFMAQTGMAPDLLENLGSAIAKVGIDSNATEAQILSLMREISAGGTGAGFAEKQLVGLAGTLASLQIAPERARGALDMYFGTLNKAVSAGGKDLQSFAQVVGVSADELERMVRSGEGNKVLRGFLDGLKDLDNVDTTTALNELGLSQLRVENTFRRLSHALGLYDRDQQNANQAFGEATELQRQYGYIVDDLASKWTMFQNAMSNAAAAIGAEVAPTFGALLDLAKDLVTSFSAFVESDTGAAIVRMAATVGILSAAIFAVAGVLAIAGGSALAFRFALKQIASSGLVAALAGVGKAIVVIGSASGTAAGLTVALGNAFKYVLRATVVGAVLYAISEAIFNTGDAAQWAGGVLIEFTNFLFDMARNINNLTGLELFSTSGGFTQTVADWGKGLQSWGKSLGSANKSVNDFSAGQLDMNGLMDDFSGAVPDATSGMDDYGDAAAGAAEKIYTLKDYASDLAEVWGRAFEIRFSGQQTIDTVQNSLQKLRDAAEASAKRVTDLRSSIRSLSADSQDLKSDISILEYYLRIANEYGDTKRATAIEAELAKKRAELSSKTQELADKNKELKKEQDSQSKTLVGNSQAARDNRKSIEDLVQQYQAHIGALATSGMSQEDLARATQRLKADFIQQATQLGYNRQQLNVYAKAFDDVTVAISRVPRNITVTANANPAIQAFNEYASRANNALNSIRANAGKPINFAPIGNPNNAKELRRMALEAEMTTHARNATFLSAQGGAANMQGARLSAYEASRIRAVLASGNYWSGGYTGAGGKYEPKGIVHGGEYVFRKDQVNQSTGLPHAGALLSMLGSLPSRSVAPAAVSGGGGGTSQVALTAGTIQAIAQAVQPYIVLNDRIVGEASSKAYAYDNTTGAY